MVRVRIIERDVGIGEIVHDVDAVLPRQRDNALEEIELDALRGGVTRKPENHHPRLGQRLADRTLEFGEEIHAAIHAHRANVGPGDDRAVNVDRVTRVRHEHGITAIERGKHQMRQPSSSRS